MPNYSTTSWSPSTNDMLGIKTLVSEDVVVCFHWKGKYKSQFEDITGVHELI